MMMKRFFLLLAVFFTWSLCKGVSSNVSNTSRFHSVHSTRATLHSDNLKDKKPNSLIQFIRKKLQHTKRAVAAFLALPLPFGILALHRIYLGTKPFVPVVYIGTIGGVFGILPFIDFCVLLLDRDIDRFMNNGKVFMWIQ